MNLTNIKKGTYRESFKEDFMHRIRRKAAQILKDQFLLFIIKTTFHPGFSFLVKNFID